MDLFLSYKSPPLATIYVNSFERFFELRICYLIGLSSCFWSCLFFFVEFIVLHLFVFVNTFFEYFLFILKLSKKYGLFYIFANNQTIYTYHWNSSKQTLMIGRLHAQKHDDIRISSRHHRAPSFLFQNQRNNISEAVPRFKCAESEYSWTPFPPHSDPTYPAHHP